MRRNILVLAAMVTTALTAPGVASSLRAAGMQKLKQVAAMKIPGKKIGGFDISWVDQKTQRYFLADRTNKAIDIFDGRTDKYVGAIPGFVGVKMTNGKVDDPASGPNGVLVYGNIAWVGDGDSAAKEANLTTRKIIATVSTGGKNRCDEIAYDPKNHVLACGNGDEDPPFLSLISTTGLKVIAKISFPRATNGLEAPVYDAVEGLFYDSIPELDHNPKKSGVAVVNPEGKLEKILPVESCDPAGIVFGPHQDFLLGCDATGEQGMPPVAVVMNARTGKQVARVPGAGGSDEVAYSARNQQYYTGSSDMNPSAMFVIDALTNKLVQTIRTSGNAHSVAASDVTGKVFVPESADGGCGCIRVFAPEM
jgi:DNA-binding beta-propeller fold protein YncE